MVPILVVLALLGLLYGVGGAIANKVSRLNQEDYARAQQAGNLRGRQAPTPVHLPGTLLTGIISGLVFFAFTIFWIFIVQIDGQNVGVITTPHGVKNEAVHSTVRIIINCP